MKLIITTENNIYIIDLNDLQRKRMAFQLLNNLDISLDLKEKKITNGGLNE